MQTAFVLFYRRVVNHYYIFLLHEICRMMSSFIFAVSSLFYAKSFCWFENASHYLEKLNPKTQPFCNWSFSSGNWSKVSNKELCWPHFFISITNELSKSFKVKFLKLFGAVESCYNADILLKDLILISIWSSSKYPFNGIFVATILAWETVTAVLGQLRNWTS